MTPSQINVYLLSNGKPEYIILNRKLFKLEECDDETMANSYNHGDALPILGKLNDKRKIEDNICPV